MRYKRDPLRLRILRAVIFGVIHDLPEPRTPSNKHDFLLWRIWHTVTYRSVYIFAIAVLVVAALVFKLGVPIAYSRYSWQLFAQDFYANAVTDLVGIAITILIINTLIERRQTADKKAELIRDLGSKTNDFALRAARELQAHGWLSDGTLRGAYLDNANLVGGDLDNANLRGVYLNDANLTDVVLNDADLRDAEMLGANLTGASLIEANLTGASLTEANLMNADLWGANLRGTYLDGANLTGARYTNDTKWPEGFNPKAAGAINIEELIPEEGKPTT